MSDATLTLAKQNGAGALIEQVVIQGDLSRLSPEQRGSYYRVVCDSLGLNPLTQPFAYLNLNNKLVLYATKGATDQLRSLRHVSLTIVSREIVNDLYVVTARATLPDGRCDEEIGAVSIKALGGEALANAMMKASTKAKRRVTLSVCGLGILDELEVETIPGAVRVELPDGRAPDAAQPSSTQGGQAGPARAGRPVAAAEQPAAEGAASRPDPTTDQDASSDWDRLESPSQAPVSQHFHEAEEAHRRAVAAGVKAAPPNPQFTDEAIAVYVGSMQRAIEAAKKRGGG